MNAIYGSLGRTTKYADHRRTSARVQNSLSRWLPVTIAALAVALAVWVAPTDKAAAALSIPPLNIAAF